MTDTAVKKSEKMITKFAKRFADDTTFQDMCKALEEKNAKEAFRMAHTLKGICSNLGFDELYKASQESNLYICLYSL